MQQCYRFQLSFTPLRYSASVLKCVELTPRGVDTWYLPLEPATAHRVHRDKGNTNLLVSYETRQVNFALQPAALSIKCSFAGPVNYVVDDRRVVVDEDRYLLVNHAHPYRSFVRHEAPVRAFSVFFGKPFVEDVVGCMVRSEEALLADPDAGIAATGVFEHLQPHDPRLLPALRDLHVAHETDDVDPAWLGERLHVLLGGLLRRDRTLRAQVDALPAVRGATRLEIFRRVHVARDHVDSCYAEPLTLDDLAAQACMSPHHFLRSFKQVVGQTPHQYLLRVRLARARRLLDAADLTVAEAATRVGFESWEHFSRQFRREFGMPPGAARRNKLFSSFPRSA